MDVIASIITLVLLMAAGTRVEMQQIQLGASVVPNGNPAWWSSPSGQFAFGFYPQEQRNAFIVAIWLVGQKNRTVVWSAGRDDPVVNSNAKLQLTMDGKLVLMDGLGEEKVKVIAGNDSSKASSASMLDSGNFVLYNNNSSIIWQSFNYPTDTLLGGQSLLPNGHQLVSSSSQNSHSSGRYRLKMQDDGNLVLYPLNTADTPSDADWASDTLVGFKTRLYLNQTGLLQIINGSDGSLVKSLPRGSSLPDKGNMIVYRSTLDFDGIFRLYAHFNNGSFQKVGFWPDEGNACAVKGFCGFNSYCTINDIQPLCNCLPGFDLVYPNDSTLGCKRSFQKENCIDGEKDSASFYNMKSMGNIMWADFPYWMSKMLQQEDCSFACFADCNCEAAFFVEQDGTCRRHKLPLRYLRRLTNEHGGVLFLKVGNSSLKNGTTGNDNPVPALPIKTTSNKATVQIVVITSVFSLLLCSTILISIHYMYKIRILRYKRLMETGNMGLNEEVTLRRFSYGELKRATNNFKQELGKGSFGAVYKGILDKGKRLIAVKRLEKLVEEGEREFQAEMRAIGKTHHRNLVRLLGFCIEGSKRLLIYEYMPNASLGNLIFGTVSQRRPEWDERVRIAVEIAKGILYLHEECEAPVIHCDIKPQNILMDEFWTAKISDFGLAKLLMPDQTRTFTGARGTRGYMAPEWNNLNIPISVKADVYSYGIVLLEILCCRRNIEIHVSHAEEVLLSNWAYKCFVSGQLHKLLLWEAVDAKTGLENMVKVALWCIQDEPVLRPTMKTVVLMLEGITDIATPPCPNSNSV